jgi:hypothetical protein
MKKDSSMANDQNDSKAKSEFDRNSFEHIELGVWDLYVMRTRLLRYLPTSRKMEEYAQIWKDIPYLRRTLCDMSTVAWPLLSLYLVITLAKSLIPALSLWLVCFCSPFLKLKDAYILSRFSGQVLGIVRHLFYLNSRP